MLKKKSGFVDLTLVVAVVLILLVGGFTLYRINSTNDEMNSEKQFASDSGITETNIESTDNDMEEDNVPEGWTKYSDSGTGVEFIYPSSWGEAKTVNLKNEVNYGYVGESYRVSFSENSSATAYFKSTDYELTGGGGDAPSMIRGSKSFSYEFEQRKKWDESNDIITLTDDLFSYVGVNGINISLEAGLVQKTDAKEYGVVHIAVEESLPLSAGQSITEFYEANNENLYSFISEDAQFLVDI